MWAGDTAIGYRPFILTWPTDGLKIALHIATGLFQDPMPAMSNETQIYGRIDVPRWGQAWDTIAMQTNRQAIERLPDTDDWPPLIRGMFSVVPERVAYRSWLIPFAAAVPGLDEQWDVWLNKFEDLLRSMTWFSVDLHLNTDYSGRHWFSWIADVGQLHESACVESWTFESGPDGRETKYNPPIRSFDHGTSSAGTDDRPNSP